MSSNAGRAIFIVYSLFTIPIITILISLMSDTFLAKFQKSAEKFGVKGGEDERYLGMQKRNRARGSRWKFITSKLFRKTSHPTDAPTRVDEGGSEDVERQDDAELGVDDYLTEEVMDEVRDIRRSVDQEVDAKLEKTRSSVSARSSEVEVGTSGRDGGTRRRTWRDIVDDADGDDAALGENAGEEDAVDGEEDDEIDEEDVQRVIKENRGGNSEV